MCSCVYKCSGLCGVCACACVYARACVWLHWLSFYLWRLFLVGRWMMHHSDICIKCVPVDQWLEHCVSSAKVVGSIPREHMY